MIEPHKSNVMVVDDTSANLKLLSNMLSEAGYSVRPFPSGELALKAAANDPPDAILLDINMPKMNGYEVCEQLKSDPALKDVPVIFISALTETFDKIKAFNCGGVDYVTKPFQFEEVHARLEAHLKLYEYQQLLEQKNQELEDLLAKLKEAQMQLVESEKMASLGVLTAGVAHEINNPVNFISTGLSGVKMLLQDFFELYNLSAEVTAGNALEKFQQMEKLKAEIGFDELVTDTKRIVENMETGVARTVEIINGLRTFTRLDEEDRKAVDLHENIDATLLILSQRHKNRIRIIREYGHLPRIPCFPGKLNQVFMNLLSNAIDAIEDKPQAAAEETISIGTRLEKRDGKSYVVIEIRDSGGGIPEEIRERIFEPFFTTKDVGRGNGLGLAISLGGVQSHEGTLDVESEVGQGSCFRICLPFVKEEE